MTGKKDTVSDSDNAFAMEVQQNIEKLGGAGDLIALSRKWIEAGAPYKYSYNFSWLGRPIIQYPQDIVALQEIVWLTKPEIIVETGIAHGGSLVFFASLLELIGGSGRVVGVDIDIRAGNRAQIESHPMSKRIHLIQGSSIADAVVKEVGRHTAGKRTMVILDSNHSHQHVLSELNCYSPMVSESYLVVLDTIIEELPDRLFPNRPWGRGNNPKTAVHEFLASTDRFKIDQSIHQKLLITVAPDGYLVCVKA